MANSQVRMDMAGMDALLKNIQRMAGPNAAAIEERVLREAAEPILAEAQKLVNVRTEKLKGKITVSKVRRIKGSGSSIKIGVPRNAGVAYGIPLEWGHVNRDGTVTAPRPFMWPAYVAKKDEAYGIIRDGLRDELLKGGGGG